MKFYLRKKMKKICQETTELMSSIYLHFSSYIFLFDASNFASSLVTKITFVMEQHKIKLNKNQIFL